MLFYATQTVSVEIIYEDCSKELVYFAAKHSFTVLSEFFLKFIENVVENYAFLLNLVLLKI